MLSQTRCLIDHEYERPIFEWPYSWSAIYALHFKHALLEIIIQLHYKQYGVYYDKGFL